MSGGAAPLDIETRAGRVVVDPADVVHFAHGLPGFEACRRFVVVAPPDIAPFTWLHGLDAPAPSFLAVDPRRVLPDYDVALGEADRARLGAAPGDQLLWLAIVHVDDRDTTVNLRAPVVIHPARMTGLQVVAADMAYATDFGLAEA
ncbi:MAG: flagellar assembly protein FliW [Vicinamibacterales bacterium]